MFLFFSLPHPFLFLSVCLPACLPVAFLSPTLFFSPSLCISTVQIANLQKESRLERKLKLNSHNLKHKKKLMKVRLLCRLCQRGACTADDIRCIQHAHHVVLSEAFESSCILTEVERRSVCPDLELCKRIMCGNKAKSCTQEWGKQMLYKGILVSLITPENFVMVMPNGQKRLFKKWKDVPFTVQDISTEELDKACNVSISDEEEEEEEEEMG